ncbi:hypothetical protein SAMN04487819_11072 [Actinopolyspora alba]|uniref:GGDEF domain-containing protein, diguanylate cyclase (C-di-GMP synthetase) or its enzymatically inactive variants n=1 Tax=Actinopolyspora alba TaxID=673379 RepID=A0A1I1Z962_9ACTN|nr:hypothetical protein SAMN04487819_11072 [Actinopolyspora alba]
MEPPREQSPEQSRCGGESNDPGTSQPRDSNPGQRGSNPGQLGARAIPSGRATSVAGGAERYRALRSRWRGATLASGWPFPGDWACPAVDRVCEAVIIGDDPGDAVDELAAQRADSGIGLDETLRDLGVLHAVLSREDTGTALVSEECDDVPTWLLRRAALAWADVVAGRSAAREVTDALTGLSTLSYLRMRLYEVYRETRAAGAGSATSPGRDSYALLVVTLRLPGDDHRWARLMAVVLAADVLRDVFDAGETVSLLRESTPVVLTRDDTRLAERCSRAETAINERVLADPELARALDDSGSAVRIRRSPLPTEYSGACELLTSLR